MVAGVDVFRLPAAASAQEVALAWAQTFWAGYKIISQNDITFGPETQGYEVVFSFDTGQGFDVKFKEVAVVRGTNGFVLHSRALPSVFEAKVDEIDSFMSGFTLQEPRPFGVSRKDSLFLLGGEILTLDPALFWGSAGGIPGSIFSGLVALDRDLEVFPDLAESWTVNADGTVYTFQLREGLRFHDGRAVTAQDVKYSWERAADPETESPTARTYLGDIVGVKEKLDGKAREISGVQVIDNLSLRVTIDGPKPYFLGKLAYPTSYIVDQANVRSGKTWTERANGTGPFKLKEWVEDEILILERNDLYYRGVAKLAHVVYQLFAGDPMMLYEQGKIDVTGVGLSDIERVLDPANLLNRELIVTPLLCTSYPAVNVTMPPFDDAKVRQAFALALDVDRWIEVTVKGVLDRAAGILPPGLLGYNEDLKPVPFDPDMAKQLIADSKYGSVDNLPQVTGFDLNDAFLSMWLNNLGVEVQNIEIEELQEYFDLRGQKRIPVEDTNWCADYPDPQNFLQVLFQTDSKGNHLAYSNPEVDAALKLAAVERDEAARVAMYQDIEGTILNDWVAVPLAHFKSYTLVKAYVQGYFVARMGIHILKDVSISRE